MQFKPIALGNQFRNAVDWMIGGQHGPMIDSSIKHYQRRQAELSRDPDAESALRLLVDIKITNSFRRTLSASKSQQFEADFGCFLQGHGQNLRTSQAKDSLGSLIVSHSVFKIDRRKADKWVEELMDGKQTLKDFTDDLHRLRVQRKKNLLEPKGADLYLRDVGFFDIAPVDLHQRRFLVRTGIFHAFALPGREDPLDYNSLQDALSMFCTICLTGKLVNGVDLGSAPGIVDLLIWFFCSDRNYEICGSTPRCSGCVLSSECLYSLTGIQNALNTGQTQQEYGLPQHEVQQHLKMVLGARPVKVSRTDWAPVRSSFQKNPQGFVQALKNSGKSRSYIRGFLRAAGVPLTQINLYCP